MCTWRLLYDTQFFSLLAFFRIRVGFLPRVHPNDQSSLLRAILTAIQGTGLSFVEYKVLSDCRIQQPLSLYPTPSGPSLVSVQTPTTVIPVWKVCSFFGSILKFFTLALIIVGRKLNTLRSMYTSCYTTSEQPVDVTRLLPGQLFHCACAMQWVFSFSRAGCAICVT